MDEIASTVDPVSANIIMWAMCDPCETVATILGVLLLIFWIPPSFVMMEAIDPEDFTWLIRLIISVCKLSVCTASPAPAGERGGCLLERLKSCFLSRHELLHLNREFKWRLPLTMLISSVIIGQKA